MKQPASQHANSIARLMLIGLGIVISLLIGGLIKPAFAHHGAEITTVNGFWVGITHPLMGLDHLALIASAGLLASRKKEGMIWAFTSSSLMGIAVAILGVQIPSMLVISISLFLIGVLLTQVDTVTTGLLVAGVAIAGFCHGYPHAALLETFPASTQINFLISFTLTQLAVGHIICYATRQLLPSNRNLIYPGLGICGIGVAYLLSGSLL
ncbi:HupE/UreJ family protein [Acaryochloris sp. IP29b_bin.148]|uniref:HupE/UreJ family protein n=1 Tax=Acaryochloris sp. IP29b_bin.148 TaxID=2969218 RepID=UPI002618FF61|nr:HupE/UreJ family protein [Acaryochloris sp. IP29b_bin.148]